MAPKKRSVEETKKPDAPAGSEADKELAGRYQKVSHVDHILLRPEMYVGSIENHGATQWLFADDAARAEIPSLLPPGEYEKKLIELKKNTVKLPGTRGVRRASAEEDGAEGEFSEDALEDMEEADDAVEEINGVDKRLIVDEGKMVTAFPPGSQAVGKVYVNPGLLKIVDEIIVNAADNRLVPATKPQTYIRVTFDDTTGEISVQNDGAAIPIAHHPQHNVYVPEMIFGSLLTSSHYGNDPNSIAAGRHGFGAKLTNILSEKFCVECVKDNKRFIGKWSDNMKQKDSVEVGVYKHQGDYTKVSFVPEYKRFIGQDLVKAKEAAAAGDAPNDNLVPVDFNIIAQLGKILKRRLLDLSASIGGSLNVYYNDELLTPTDFTEYVRMHMPASAVARQPFVQSSTAKEGNALACDYGIMFVAPPKQGEVAHQHHHVSLVNGIVTHQGGTHLRHLNAAFEQALTLVSTHLEKEERLMLNVAQFKQNTTLFVNVLVHQSKFDSQSKDRLVSKHTYAPIKLQDVVRHILLLPFIRNYCMTSDKMTAALESALVSMTRQKNLMRMIPKLVEPADMTIKTHRTLILTEGDSAKALALNSLSSDQRQTFGVLPLRGKILNVRNAHPRKIAANKEIVHVLAALGLSTKTKYSSHSELRYQRLMIMTDQDYDGFHIRGLVVSLINYYWPELMKAIPDFVSIFSTPLIKARVKGDTNVFYCVSDYKKWLEAQPQPLLPSIKTKYYKGLGTSTTEEGREYFKHMEDNVRFIKATDAETDADLMEKTFGNGDDNVRWRKNWVLGSKIVADMESGRGSLTIPDFVNQQLVQFALADNLRSFPDIRDGLRSSHRKIIWAMLNRKSSDSLRVSQCAGYVSETSNYHHGEMSLLAAIIGLAQSHVGSNNIPLLLGEGQFGSRINAGRDAAAPRYIFTNIAPIARKLFPAADDELLEYEDQEGTFAEPVAYAPVVPMHLINGSIGIGVGFAGKHLPHDVNSVVAAINAMLKGKSSSEAAKELKVGVTGFRGTIKQDPKEAKRMIVTGDFELYAGGAQMPTSGLVLTSAEDRAEYRRSDFSLGNHTIIRITELPFTMAIEDYRKSISEKLDDIIVTIADHSGANHVDIIITVDTRGFLTKFPVVSKEAILQYLGLVQSMSQFMVCINEGTINNFATNYEPQLDAFFKHRLEVYGKRLALTRERLAAETTKLEGHIKFTELVKAKGTKLMVMSEEDLHAELKKNDVPLIDGSFKTYLSRSFASLMKDNAENLRAKLQSTRDALKHSQEVDTPKSLWAADLKEFAAAYNTYEQATIKSIADDYKGGKKKFGPRLTIDGIISDIRFMGYSPERGWSGMRIAKRAKKATMMKARAQQKAMDEKAEVKLKELDAALEASAEALAAAEAEAARIKSGPKAKSSLELIRVNSALREAQTTHKANLKKKESFRERFGGRGAAAAGGSAAASNAAGNAATTAMIAPIAFMATAPFFDTVLLARQRVAMMAANRAQLGARSILRLFARSLL